MSCSLNTDTSQKSATYTFIFSHADWKRQQDLQVDHIFVNNKNSQLAVKSLCARYLRTPLKSLSENLTAGITKKEVHREEKIMFENREAVEIIATGEIDGLPIALRALTVRKNNCLYDIFLTANSLTELESYSDVWNQALKGFSIQ